MTSTFRNAIQKVKPDGDLSQSIIPGAYDIEAEDMMELLRMVSSGDSESAFRAVAMAFEYGFVMGNRCTHSRKMRKL